MAVDISRMATEGLTPEERKVFWRVAVAIYLCVHVPWVEGWIPGVSGFAKVSEMEKLSDEVTEIKKELWLGRISEAQDRYCKAGNGEARRYWIEKRNRYVRQYEEETTLALETPECPDLGYREPED